MWMWMWHYMFACSMWQRLNMSVFDVVIVGCGAGCTDVRGQKGQSVINS